MNVQTTTRKKPPFGIAQVGKSFRNEITPGNFVFRTREFEQMEMEFFVPPEDGAQWYEYWCQERYRWYTELGIPDDKLRLRPHEESELSHYSAGTSDVEFMYPWGWGELEGIANRTDFDLTQHSKFSGQDLSYYDQEHDRRYLPHVIEPAAGADRATLAFLLAAYDEEDVANGKGGTEKRTVLHLHPRLAPIKVAVLPLSKNEQLVPLADEVASLLRAEMMIDVDVTGSIGRRYRRQDEVGTPLCVTVDFDTLDDRAVTIRDRDTMTQERVPIDGLLAELQSRLVERGHPRDEREQMSDHYEELGVEPTATKDEIRDAHRARLAELEAARGAQGRDRRAAPGQPRRGGAGARRVERALRPDAAPALRPAAHRRARRRRAGDDGLRRGARRRRHPGRARPHRLAQAPRPAAGQGAGGKGATGKAGAAGREPKAPAHPNRPPPSIDLPAGVELATTKARGMALAFDLAICIVLVFICFNFIPNLIQSDYTDIVDQVAKVTDVRDAQSSVNDAQKSFDSAKSSAKKSAQNDLTSAEKDLTKAEKAAKKPVSPRPPVRPARSG